MSAYCFNAGDSLIKGVTSMDETLIWKLGMMLLFVGIVLIILTN